MPKEHFVQGVDFDRIQSACRAVMGGHSWAELQPEVNELTDHERRVLLCTLCGLLEEICVTSNHHAAECMKMLAHNCPFFSADAISCQPEDRSSFAVWLGWKAAE